VHDETNLLTRNSFHRALYTLAWGGESYPTLYRGEVSKSGSRLVAHFQKSFLGLAPAAQAGLITKAAEGLGTYPNGKKGGSCAD
jgi:hypothetical protein